MTISEHTQTVPICPKRRASLRVAASLAVATAAASHVMSMAYNLRFLTEIENGNIATVQKMVVGGSINVNQPYLSVFPLNLAIESGNIDMVAVLLTASADPLLKFNPKQTPETRITHDSSSDSHHEVIS